ncbi:WD40 repeat domain-containing protein [Paraburkholderia hiiakae]|uniref:WD40 repeat domain-containing protein n=1 Tax=Paraburkholderia hiiakae TaxID=1081782 RepID=UPI001918433E|nr:WD40 repeat domain-containing protein [Paraburkholderia hiiakae]
MVRRLQAVLLITLLGWMALQSTHATPPRLEPQLAPSDSAGLYAAQRGKGYVANLGNSGEVSLWRWDADSNRLERVLTLRDTASTLRLTNDGGAEEPLLAVGTFHGEIKLYDTTGRLLCRSQLPQYADSSQEPQDAVIVQIEASEAQNVVVAADNRGAVHLWDARCKERKLNAYKHDLPVTSLVLSKNIAITASSDGTLGAIELTGAEPLPRMRFSEELFGIRTLALAEDGSRFALAVLSGLYLFETGQLEQMFRSGQKPKLLRKLEASARAVALLRPGDRLLYQDSFAGLMLWDLRTGETRQLRQEVSQFSVAADGATVYVVPSYARDLQVFRLGFSQADPPVRLSSTEAISGIAIAQGRIVAATARGKIRFIDAEGIVEPVGVDTGKEVYTFAMSKDGSAIALASSGIGIDVLDAKTLASESHYYGGVVSERASGNLSANMQTTALDFFPDGKSFAAVSTFGVVSLWDRHKAGPVHEYTADSVTRLRLSPDGQHVALMIDDDLDDKKEQMIIIANLKDREDRVKIHEPHGRNLVTSITFSAKGDLLATVGSDDRTKVWDATRGTMIEEFAMDDPVGIYTAEFIEGDQALLLIMKDGSVAVLDRKGGAAPKLRYSSNASAWAAGRLEARATAVSPDGAIAVVGTRDGSVLVWRYGLQLLTEVSSSSVSLSSMAISFAYLVCGSSNSVPMCWDLQRGLLPVPAQAENGSVESIAASPSGHAIAAIRQVGYVTVWPADSPRKAVTVPTDGISGQLWWSLDGSTIYVVGADYGSDVVTRLAVDSAGASAKAMAPWKAPGRISGLFPLEDGGIAVMVGQEIHVLQPSLRETERIIVPESCVQHLRFQPVSFLSRDLVAYSCDESVLVMKREGSGWRQILSQKTFGMPSGFGFDPKRKLLVSGDSRGDLNVWDLQAGKLLARLSVGQPIQAVGMRGDMLVAGTADGQLLFYRLSDQAELGRAILDADGAMVASADGWYGVSGRPALQLAAIESSKESASETISSRNSMATVNAVLLERDQWTVRVRELLARQISLARASFVSLSFLEQLGVIAVALYSALVLVMAVAWVFAPARLFVWSLKLSSSWTANSMSRLQEGA